MKKRIIILGSTGSIGRNCIEVVERYPDRFEVVGLSAWNNWKLLAEQADSLRVKCVLVGDERYYKDTANELSPGIKLFSGDETADLIDAAGEIDLVVNALVGAAGLKPSLESLERGITLALANKESLVAGGALMVKTLAESKADLLPIDSEHSAIFQCLLGEDRKTIRGLILTASGGPFVDKPLEEFETITPALALKHPNWEMGQRITIDSATMVNKGLEVIEAHWLFDIPPEKIQVVIHRQSIIHSLVRFDDGSYLAQMGAPDMRLPIQFALTYPERLMSPYCELDWDKPFNLDFQPVPYEKYPGLSLAFEALQRGGLFPAALNAADETAVAAFLQGKIKFTGIPVMIEKAMDYLDKQQSFSYQSAMILDDILAVDSEIRKYIRNLVKAE